jgi:hypothetical protein
MKGDNPMHTNSKEDNKKKRSIFREMLESYLEKWDDPTCRPKTGI